MVYIFFNDAEVVSLIGTSFIFWNLLFIWFQNLFVRAVLTSSGLECVG